MSDTGVRRRRAQLNWLLSVLPAFPLVLLVLRLWYLSRQDLPTMLLLVQYVSPLGMISALVVTLFWAVPGVVLVLRALGALLLVSAGPALDATRSLLALTALRMPDWVVLLAAVLAALTWQLRFLPLLLMIMLSIMGLTAWQRHPDDRAVLRVATMGFPALAVPVAYLWLWPGIVSAVSHRELVNVALLALPPLLALGLTGPVPARFARLVTHWPAMTAALIAPFVIGAVFLRAPILPSAAVEFAPDGPAHEVVRGHVIAVDDTTTTVLDRLGVVHFVPNAQVRSKTLCPEASQAPVSAVLVRGWPVEGSVLQWVAPARRITEKSDPRCLGRPLTASDTPPPRRPAPQATVSVKPR